MAKITRFKLTPQESMVVGGIINAQKMCHNTAKKSGWYNDPNTGEKIDRNFGEVIALMHSELSESLEAHRKDLMDDKLPRRKGTEVELADLLIRVFDTAEALDLCLGSAVIEKNRYNQKRKDHKLKYRKLPGGKKY